MSFWDYMLDPPDYNDGEEEQEETGCGYDCDHSWIESDGADVEHGDGTWFCEICGEES
jgi:hypothetical protein